MSCGQVGCWSVWRRQATYRQRWSSRIFSRVWLRTSTPTKDPTMTDDNMDLRCLLEKIAETDLLRKTIGLSAQRLIELGVENLTGAPHGARAAARLTHRNGYRERERETRASTVELRIPKLRNGSLDPLRGPGPRLPRTVADGREGTYGDDPGSLRPGHLHPLGRLPCAGHGKVRHRGWQSAPRVRLHRLRGRRPPVLLQDRLLRPAYGGRFGGSQRPCQDHPGADPHAGVGVLILPALTSEAGIFVLVRSTADVER